MGPQKPSTQPSGSPAPPAPAFDTSVTDTTLSDAIAVLRKRRWIIIAIVLAGALFGFYRARTQPRLYTAVGKIEVRAGSSNQFRVAGSSYNSDNRMTTEVEILHSDTLLLTVAREMDLANNSDFLGASGPVQRQNLNDPAVRQRMIDDLNGGLRVGLVPRTNIIAITFTGLKPQLAADIVNHVINAYIQRSYETRFASTKRVSEWLSNQLDDLKQQVETSQEQLMDLQKRIGVLGFDPSHAQNTSATAAIEALSGASISAKITRILAESRFRELKSADPNTFESTITNTPGIAPGDLQRLRGDFSLTTTQLAQQSVELGPNHPKTRALQAHLDEVKRQMALEQDRLLTQARQTYLAAQANEQQTTEALEAQKTEAYKMRDSLVEYTLRQREFESNRTLYDGLLSRLRAAGIEAGLDSMEIDIIDPAMRPVAPSLISSSSIILTTTFFALLGSIVLAFLLESLDTGLRSIAEIEAITQLPSLAIIPKTKRPTAETAANLTVAQRNIGVLATTRSQFAEAMRSLRTSLLLATTGHPPKLILMTSATPAEGKTTVATNLACVLAQRDTRVLLIDADLRRPNVHHRFGLSAKVGLSTVLAGATRFEDAVVQIPDVPNLDVLPSGPVPPFPTEMLSSDVMNELLANCAKIYTHIVVDSPPILSVTDSVILARHVDAVALVVRHGKSSRQIVRRARDLLLRAGAPITGVVLNAVNLNSPEYYGYYGYSGYAYANIDSGSWDGSSQENGREGTGGQKG